MSEVNYGDRVEFTYLGSQDEYFGQRLEGVVVPEPHIVYEGGEIPLADYAADVQVVEAA